MVDNIIKSLNSLHYETCSEQEIYNLFISLGTGSAILANYYPAINKYPPNFFTRATIYNPNLETITKVSRLSYPPAEINYRFGGYQRASTPYKSMFYGTRLQSLEPNDLYSSIKTCLKETIVDYNELLKDGKKVMISLWQTVSQIKLFAIFQNDQFLLKNIHMAEVNEAYQLWLTSTPKNLQEDTHKILNFIAEHFSIPVGRDYHLYKPSAVISQYLIDRLAMFNHYIDGVVFPSTKVEGQELNIAIKPMSADFKLSCSNIMDCTFLPNQKLLIEKRTQISERQEDFNFDESCNIEINV